MNNTFMQHEKSIIKPISTESARDLCKKIAADLPEWFGQAETNEHYASGMLTRVSFAAIVNSNYIGLITLESLYVNNVNIYWMGILRNFHNQGIGKRLLHTAENYALTMQAKSLTVETLSLAEDDANYYKTYNFYLKCGFSPLFDLKPYGPDQNMVYMYKNL